MSQLTARTNGQWLKILGKGMVTLPKKWREDLGLEEGDIVRAKKKGNKVIIEPQQNSLASSRVYSIPVSLPQRRLLKGKSLTKDDSLFDLIGIGRSGRTDISANKHKNLAEIYLSHHK